MKKEHQIEVGKKIRELRKGENMTMQELGNRIGSSRNYIHRIEKGIGNLSDTKADEILKIFRKKLNLTIVDIE